MSQSSDTSAIGSSLTLTATVTWSGGAATEPTAGWSIEFTGTGDGGWTSGPVATDDGEATYTRSSPVAQTETITARIANAGCTGTVSNTLTHEWWRGEIVITNPETSSDVDADFTLTGRVLRSGEPVLTADVRVEVADRGGSNAIRSLATETDGAGEFAVSWSTADAAVERVAITATGSEGFSTSVLTHHSWSGTDPEAEADQLTLAAAPEVRVGERVLATSQLLSDGAPVANQTVQFWTDQGWLNPITTGDTQASFNYAARFTPGPGFYGVRDSQAGVLRASGVTRWWQPTITFVSPDSSSVVGQEYPAAVVVTDDGVPLAGIELAFSLDGSEVPYGNATTDVNGYASAPVTVDGEDSPLIEVSEVPDESTPVPATASTDHTWAAGPSGVDVSVDLTQSSQESRVGTSVQLNARVRVGDGTVAGWDVAFAAGDDSLGVRVTGEDGIATLTTPRYEDPTSQSFTATVAIDGCTPRSAAVFHYWWQPDLELTPKDTTSPARSDVTFTASLTRFTSSEDTVAVPGQLIRFSMTSQDCTLPVAVRDDRTNDDGIATVTLSRDGPSVDRIRATEIGVVGPASDATTHTWGAPAPPPLSIALTQDRASSRAGTEVIITATVRDADRAGGRARAGLPVTFLGVSPTRTVPTDASGSARLILRGTSTNPTTVTASAPFGCGVVVSGTVTHRWFVPTLELTPDTAATTTDDTASVTAVLTDGAEGVAGQPIRLTIDHRTNGIDTLTRTETTDGTGQATFTWKRSAAGVDDLTAIELIGVQPQQDTARHDWVSVPTPPPDSPTPQQPDAPPVTIPSDPGTPTPVEESEPPEEPTPAPAETTSPPAPPTDTPPADLPATSTLVDGPEVGRPGADIELSGTGCRAGQSLTVRLGESTLGRTRAAADGTFYLRGVVPDLPLGRYVIRSTCGTTIGDPDVDITAPQVNKARASIAAVGVTTASTFVFFLLLAKGVISFLPRRPS